VEHSETLANGLKYVFVLPNDIALGVDLHVSADYQPGVGETDRADLRDLVTRWSMAGCEGSFAPPPDHQRSGRFHGPADLTTTGNSDNWTVDLGSALGSLAIAALLSELERWDAAPAVLEALVFRME